MHADEDTTVVVDHVYEPEGTGTCEDCGKPAHDPGMVGLTLAGEEESVSALMEPSQALVLAERLQRAASLVLESQEDAPDMEREAARYTAAAGRPE